MQRHRHHGAADAGRSGAQRAFAVGNTILAVRVGQDLGADLRSAIVRKVQTFSFGNLDRLQTGQLLGARDQRRQPGADDLSDVAAHPDPRAAVGDRQHDHARPDQPHSWPCVMLALLPLILALIWLFMFKARPLFERCRRSWTR